MKCAVLLFLLLSPFYQVTAQEPLESQPVYRHAYYLFLVATSNDCEDCYIPILITKEPIEQIAKSQVIANCIMITTYERDSIWKIEPPATIKRTDIEATERKVRVRDRPYRYQEIIPAEVVRLLENPEGTIPISRTTAPPSRKDLLDLISDFKAMK